MTGYCEHGWTRDQGCRECTPYLDWRERRERAAYDRKVSHKDDATELGPNEGLSRLKGA